MGHLHNPTDKDAQEWGRLQAESAPPDSEDQLRNLSNLLGLRLLDMSDETES